MRLEKSPDRQKMGRAFGRMPLSIGAGPELCITSCLTGAGVGFYVTRIGKATIQ
jgi:hypothetical protein